MFQIHTSFFSSKNTLVVPNTHWLCQITAAAAAMNLFRPLKILRVHPECRTPNKVSCSWRCRAHNYNSSYQHRLRSYCIFSLLGNVVSIKWQGQFVPWILLHFQTVFRSVEVELTSVEVELRSNLQFALSASRPRVTSLHK